ncbi:hypothetical protein KY345_02365 [Candidatus Woesearchaeota archaeon]|nr:hypothetical protein [Candidatus Woesearchaeota archaeon]
MDLDSIVKKVTSLPMVTAYVISTVIPGFAEKPYCADVDITIKNQTTISTSVKDSSGQKYETDRDTLTGKVQKYGNVTIINDPKITIENDLKGVSSSKSTSTVTIDGKTYRFEDAGSIKVTNGKIEVDGKTYNTSPADTSKVKK